jgi:hypothetical protein
VPAANENTTIVLHARDGFAACDAPQQNGLDCLDGRPTLDVTGMQMPWVYVMLRNYNDAVGLQCAFDWPVSWTFLGGTWDCLPGTIALFYPTSPGPLTGSLVMVWADCIEGGALTTVGRMIFGPASGGGCLSIIESAYPSGTVLLSCDPQELVPIRPENRGRVCAGPGGYDACWPAATAVENSTWGAIKRQYR